MECSKSRMDNKIVEYIIIVLGVLGFWLSSFVQ
jgi:hypothetical protein